MIDFFRVLIQPSKVFASMRTHITRIPPLVVLVLSVCVFSALQAWLISDEEYARINEVAHEETSRMLKPIASGMARTLVRGDQSEEKINEYLEDYDNQLDAQLEAFQSPEALKSLKQFSVVFNPLSALFLYGVILLIEATYFLIAGNMMKCTKQWSDWIGFTLWSMMPLVVYFVLFALETMWSGNYMSSGWQAPLSWIPGLGSNVFALSLTIPLVWTLWIRTVGMHRWVEKPIANCFLVAVIPTLVGWAIGAGNLQLNVPLAM